MERTRIAPPSVAIRRATPADAEALAALAARTFRDTYAADAPPEELATHLQRYFGPEAQAAELGDSAITTLLGEADGQPIAYAQVRRGPVPPCVAGPAPVELMRLYVERTWHGRGLAQALMEEVEATARAVGGRTLWLQAWERNGRALAFYRKLGFEVVGRHPFVFGTMVEMDPVLVKRLG